MGKKNKKGVALVPQPTFEEIIARATGNVRERDEYLAKMPSIWRPAFLRDSPEGCGNGCSEVHSNGALAAEVGSFLLFLLSLLGFVPVVIRVSLSDYPAWCLAIPLVTAFVGYFAMSMARRARWRGHIAYMQAQKPLPQERRSDLVSVAGLYVERLSKLQEDAVGDASPVGQLAANLRERMNENLADHQRLVTGLESALGTPLEQPIREAMADADHLLDELRGSSDRVSHYVAEVRTRFEPLLAEAQKLAQGDSARQALLDYYAHAGKARSQIDRVDATLVESFETLCVNGTCLRDMARQLFGGAVGNLFAKSGATNDAQFRAELAIVETTLERAERALPSASTLASVEG